MPVFVRSTRVAASPGQLFRFHENPHNLRAISPPHLRILDIRASACARPGETFSVAVKQGPLTLRWTGKWEVVEPPHLLVDSGLRCPFAHWKHAHQFAADGDGSILTDRVEFRLPWHLGGCVGDIFVARVVLPRMFAARHAAMQSAKLA
jgi:ligand-binding SRPBCC domain-containing protein